MLEKNRQVALVRPVPIALCKLMAASGRVQKARCPWVFRRAIELWLLLPGELAVMALWLCCLKLCMRLCLIKVLWMGGRS